MRKVLQVIDSLHLGGAERLLVEVVPILVNKGFEVDVVLLNGENTSFYEDLNDSKCCNIISLGRGYYNIGYFYKLYKLIQNYDVIHVHLFPAQYYVSILKMLSLFDKKTIFTEHSTSNRRLQSSFFRKLEKLIYRNYNTIICITEKVKDSLLSFNVVRHNKIEVIENGVNISKVASSIEADRTEFSYLGSDILLIMVAGFRREKDQDTVIRSLSKLPNNYKLLLVGDGERKEILIRLVDELGLNERVSFLGVRNDVYSLVKMCNIAILSSHWEGFGLVAVEAMACGIPVIASNVDGLAQVVEGGGMLFEKGDINDLVSKVISLENEELYDQVNNSCLEKAKNYDINNMVDKLLSIYKEI
ncbi:glycosyltransferase [Myroides sp. M-43]|uniref:glycosyltransferase n=1 Tax=Myroides oncorhynchi TaxID=2893756 RepID=UPI001E55F83F|nr:glycosyltransferase [Myroides oncorhynchi]MCC9043604.1 glycosyltransferase [Myroides oncorhynchi]